MELKQVYVGFALALAFVAGLMGCKDDAAAVSALEELTTELAMEVKDQNETLTSLSADIATCMKNLAETKGEAVVITSTSVEVDVPLLEGETTVESLKALKAALKETVDEQKAAIDELSETKAQCDKDLEAARAAAAAEAEAAAAAEAQATRQSAAQRKAAAKKRKAEESEAGQAREAEGRPATGLGSRYQKR